MSNKNTIKFIIYKLFIAIIIILSLFLLFKFLFPEKKLPVYNPHDINPNLVDQTIKNRKNGHKISDFKLIDQNGDTITQENYKNKIYVADFFFTRCMSICPIMTNNLKQIQDTFCNDDQVMLLSHSVTPLIDSVPVLKKYADKKGINAKKWHITTGDKKHIYKLARQSYFAVLDQGDGGLQDFIHTENVVLVDKKRQIRGFYDGTNQEDIGRLIKDIHILLREH